MECVLSCARSLVALTWLDYYRLRTLRYVIYMHHLSTYSSRACIKISLDEISVYCKTMPPKRSFLSPEFRPLLDVETGKLEETYVVEYANGHEYEARDIILDCALTLANKSFSIDLIPIELGTFDVVVGVDFRAEIGCFDKVVRIPLQNGETLVV